MKFSQKIFLMSFILITITISIIGILTINKNYKTSVDAQIDKGIVQINSIMGNINFYDLNNISVLAGQYLKDNTYIEVYMNGEMTYSNFLENYAHIKEKFQSEDNKIETYMENNILFMQFTQQDCKVITATNISDIEKIKNEQIEFYTKISIGCSFVISFILYVCVNLITRKIKILDIAAKQISKGNYKIDVKKLGKDEIGNLGQTFNSMAISIDKNINTINRISENRKNFISNITHEIRTPLTSIIGYSSLIKNKKVTDLDIINNYAIKINDEGIYIKEMTEKLMDLILLENTQIKLENINLSKEVTKIVKDIQETFKDVDIRADISENVWEKSDPVLLKSLILNLIKNSIEAYEKEPLVKVVLQKNGIIKVIDHGKGIPKDEIEKIKDPFYTLNKNRNREVSGMGLGLSLCTKIVEVHKGTLKIESELGKGTQIIIKLNEN